MNRSAYAAEVTARLREEEPPLGLLLSEAVCPACLPAYWLPAGTDGACRDCAADGVALELVPTD